MFHDLALIIEPEDTDSGPHMISGPIRATMKDHVVTLGDHPFNFHTFAGVITSGLLEIRDEAFLAAATATSSGNQETIVADLDLRRAKAGRYYLSTTQTNSTNAKMCARFWRSLALCG